MVEEKRQENDGELSGDSFGITPPFSPGLHATTNIYFGSGNTNMESQNPAKAFLLRQAPPRSNRCVLCHQDDAQTTNAACPTAVGRRACGQSGDGGRAARRGGVPVGHHGGRAVRRRRGGRGRPAPGPPHPRAAGGATGGPRCCRIGVVADKRSGAKLR